MVKLLLGMPQFFRIHVRLSHIEKLVSMILNIEFTF